MKFIIIHIGEVMFCPPVLNLIKMLENKKIESILVSTKSKYFGTNDYQYLKYMELSIDYESSRGELQKFSDMFAIRKQIWKIIDSHYDDETILWITSNTALKHLGNKITSYNYVFQLMELSEELKYEKRLPFKFNSSKIGNSALAVVVPEYNRAHIIKAWWNLKNIPLILSNKPVQDEVIPKNSVVNDPYAANIVKRLEGRKIILYQGIMHRERRLDKFIEAVNRLGEDYAFVIMSNGENVYKHIKSDNYFFIPYVAPPKHLQITSHAYIGVLSYFPVKSDYSILNALYCAPNKTYEYSMFGIPMIGNDNPGLKYIFDTNHAGICIESYSVDSICDAIKKIESNYPEYSKGAYHYYNSTDTYAELDHIISIVASRKDNREKRNGRKLS